MPVGQGLFGAATPYPVSPQVQQGLMGDAWRQFGLSLLANAQNPNLTQGLAGALQAGRQAYAGGAEQAYQVGREREQDRASQEYRRAQTEYYQSRAETEAAEAQSARDAAEAKEQGLQALIERIDKSPFLSPAQKEASKLRLLSGAGLTDAGLLPQEADKPAQAEYRSGASPLLRVNPDGTIETVYTPPDKPSKAKDEGMSESTRRQLAMAEWRDADKAQKAAFEAYKRTPAYIELSQTTTMAPPPAPDIAPFLAKYGLSTGPGAAQTEADAPAGSGPDQGVAQVLSSLPPEVAQAPGLAEQVARDLAGGATPEQVLEQIQAVLGGGQ